MGRKTHAQLLEKRAVNHARIRRPVCFNETGAARGNYPVRPDVFGSSKVKWRRLIGAALMILGAATVVAMAMLASVVIGNFVEWENGADAVSTIAIVALPPAVGGALLMLLGRVVYGAWRKRSPLLNASALALQIAGAVVALGLGAMLLFLVATGITPEDQTAAAALGIGTTAGLALILIGFRIKSGSGRRYLD
jgi:hypothetical protein